MTSTPTIAFPGTGRMGLPMAMNLASPAQAARGADVIITMPTDLAAVWAGTGTRTP